VVEPSGHSEHGAGDRNQAAKDQFLFPRSKYFGEFTPQNLAFNANLQEFARRIEFICALETNGKLSPTEAYDQIKDLWKNLKSSKTALIDAPPPEPPTLPEEGK
jgi:hypothetical protein